MKLESSSSPLRNQAEAIRLRSLSQDFTAEPVFLSKIDKVPIFWVAFTWHVFVFLSSTRAPFRQFTSTVFLYQRVFDVSLANLTGTALDEHGLSIWLSDYPCTIGGWWCEYYGYCPQPNISYGSACHRRLCIFAPRSIIIERHSKSLMSLAYNFVPLRQSWQWCHQLCIALTDRLWPY